MLIATKFGSDLQGANGPDWGARGSRRYIRRAVERSLRRLRTDWIDLYQLHFPDPVTPMDETLAALTELVREGKVRYVGSSNLAGWQVADAEWLSRTTRPERFVSAQNHYSLLDRQAEAELVPACLAIRRGHPALLPAGQRPAHRQVPPGRARARGHAPGQRPLRRAADRRALRRRRGARGVRRRAGVSLLDVAIGGLAAQPAVGSVIAGATRPDQVEANVAAGAWRADRRRPRRPRRHRPTGPLTFPHG